MNVIIIVESYFGNTSRIAEAVATGLRDHGATVTVADAAAVPPLMGADLLAIGSATQARGLPIAATRTIAEKKGGKAGTGIAEWLASSPSVRGVKVAVFDTVIAKNFMAGSAARAMEKLLAPMGAVIVDRKSFIVKGQTGPLADGALKEAEQWGASLAD